MGPHLPGLRKWETGCCYVRFGQLVGAASWELKLGAKFPS